MTSLHGWSILATLTARAASTASSLYNRFALLLLATSLCLGFLHGLGADHLMAIAALSVDATATTAAARRARALGVAVRFAVGHALLLGLGAGLLVLVGWSIPSVVERGGEMLGGALLIVMGAVTLWGLGSGRVYGHAHRHGQEPTPHWHLHVGRRDQHPVPGVALAPADDHRRRVRRQQPAGAGDADAVRRSPGAARRCRCCSR